MAKEDHTNLTQQERDVVRRIAARDGTTEDEAATKLVKDALERRVRKRTGKGPARIYKMGGTPRR